MGWSRLPLVSAERCSVYVQLTPSLKKFRQPHIRPYCDLGAALQGSKTRVCFPLVGRVHWREAEVGVGFKRSVWFCSFGNFMSFVFHGKFNVGTCIREFVWGLRLLSLVAYHPPPPNKKNKTNENATPNWFCETYWILISILMLSKLVLMPLHCSFTREISNEYCVHICLGRRVGGATIKQSVSLTFRRVP